MRSAPPCLAVLANGFGEQPVAVELVSQRIRRRKSPVLPARREIVRRRSDAASGDIEAPMRPQIRAAPIRGERQIVIQADGQSYVLGVLPAPRRVAGRPATAPICRTRSAARCSRRKVATASAIRVLELFGPVGPDPDVRVLLVHRTRPARNTRRTGRAGRLRRRQRPGTRRGLACPFRNSSKPSFRNRSFSA